MKATEISRSFMLFSMLMCFSAGIFAQEGETSATSLVIDTMSDKDLQWGPCPDFMPEGCEIAVLHGDPAKKDVDILFRVPANSDIPNHAHTSAERMVLLSGELDVTYEGEQPQKMVKGSYAYGPAKKPHTARCGNSGPCILFIAFEEPLDAYAAKK